MNRVKIGWSEVDITPSKRASLIGQFAERISEYVEKPITATAFAVEADGDQMILVSVDVNGISYNLVEAIREKLAQNPCGIDPEKVICAAVHTHTAPLYPRPAKTAKYGDFPTYVDLVKQFVKAGRGYQPMAVTTGDDIITPEAYFDLLTERLTGAIVTAWQARRPASYANGFGRAAVGLCRRVTFRDGTARMWGDTYSDRFEELEGGSDSGLELLYTFDEQDNLTGIVANLACPAQCVQHRKFISPDFWGDVKARIRKRFGANVFVLGLCAIAGDQCPVDLIRFVEPESDLNDPNIVRDHPPKRKADPSMFDLSGMEKTGRRIASEIIGVYEEGLGKRVTNATFGHRVHPVQLPIRTVTEGEVEAAICQIQAHFKDREDDANYNDVGCLTGQLGILRHAQIQKAMQTLESELHIIRLGNIAVATNPFEPFLKYGNQIKALSNAEQTFLVQLANGIDGYIPTKRAEKGGHYSAFVASGVVGPAGGEMMVRETVKVINELMEQE